MKAKNFLLTGGLSLALGLLGLGCSGGDLDCAAGTMEQDGQCVPMAEACGPGTVEQDGACVPACGTDEYWDGLACAPVPDCAPGTVAEGDRCVPLCGNDEYWDGNACQELPTCGTGTEYDPASGECRPTEEACGEGSSLVDGLCIPDVVCDEGSHPENGECVPDGLGEADVMENATPGEDTPFELPADGESISLGGLIDEPMDSDDDGNEESDWDAFTFHAAAGTYLRIRALSEGATRPAFVVLSEDPDDPRLTTYIRYGLEPNKLNSVREVYLPVENDYILLVTDYNHLAGWLFDSLVLPVGGPEFSYLVEVENLGAPVVEDISSLPAEVGGVLDEGQIHFYRVPALGTPAPSVLRSVGEPKDDAASDVFAALLYIGEDGTQESITSSSYKNAEMAMLSDFSGEHLVVLDHLLMIGPERAYTFQALNPDIVDCDGGACANGSVPMGSEALLRWNLAADELFMSVFGMDEAAWAAMWATWLDGDLRPLMAEQFIYPGQAGWGRIFAEGAGPRYLWLRWSEGDTPGDYLVYEDIWATPTLAVGDTASDLSVDELLPGAMPDMNMQYALVSSAFENIKLNAGQIIFFDSFTPTTGTWSEQYSEWLVTPEFEPVGPVVDTTAWNFPDGFITPNFAYIRKDGTYLHWVYDLFADITGATYSVRPVSVGADDLGEATSAQPVELDNQYLSGLTFYTFNHQADQTLQITVDPAIISTNFQPQVWVMNFGRAVWDWIYYIWQADPDAPRLGLVASVTAEGGGDTAVLEYTTPYEGMSLLLIMDAGDANLPLFSMSIQVTGN